MDVPQVIWNADVRPMTAAGARGDAIAWKNGEIVAVGSHEEVTRTAGPGASSWDARGATVLPGFIDAHQHPSLGAFYGGHVRLAPPHVMDIAGLQRALATAAVAVPKGEWVVASDWNEQLLRERLPPTREEIDDAVPDHPVLAMQYTFHRAVANSRALEAVGIGPETKDPPGGRIGRGAKGLPNGLLVERAMSGVEAAARASLLPRDKEGFFARLALHHEALVALGITRVADAAVPSDLAGLYREAARRGFVTVPTVMMPVSVTGYLEPAWDALEGPPTGETDDVLTVGPLKMIFDGAQSCAMCMNHFQSVVTLAGSLVMAIAHGSLDPIRTAMSVDPRIGWKLRSGILLHEPAAAEKVIRAAVERGFSLAIHAEGNAAVAHAVTAYEALGAAIGRAGTPRIEHGNFIDRGSIPRIAGTGAAVVAQPGFLTLPAFASAAPVPGLPPLPLRALLDAGVKVVGSSDHPCATMDPLDGIRCAVTRRDGRGRRQAGGQAVTLEEAIAMYTRSAAEVLGLGRVTGTLEAGKRADLVVLDQGLSEATLGGVRVRATVVGGRVQHGGVGVA